VLSSRSPVRATGFHQHLAPRPAALAVTAFARPEDRQLALDSGFDEHLPKPVDPDKLIELAAKLANGADHTP
jgi:CheY-like chemotaxis protein